jgi:predicted nuclease of predicted toxin-antitoxin system
VRILIDMNLSPRWGGILPGSGFEAVHWSSLGPLNATDAQIMAFAALQDYVVLTHDLDFSAILAATKGRKPSVIQLRADNISPEAVGVHVVSALRQMTDELQQVALLTIDTNRTRLRLLPLHRP